MTHVGDLIHRSLDEDLSAHDHATLEAHLSECEDCRLLRLELRRNDAMLATRERLFAAPLRRVPGPASARGVRVVAVGLAATIFALVLGATLRDVRRDAAVSSTTESPAAAVGQGATTAVVPPPLRVGPDARACAVAASGGIFLAAFGASATDRTGAQGSPCLLYASSDGQRWERAALDLGHAASAPGIGGESVSVVGIDPETGALFVGTTNGRIARAERLGSPWVTVFEPPRGTFQAIVLGFAFEGRRAYAAMKGLLVSDDGGRTWRDSSVGIGTLRPGLETRGRFGTSAPVVTGGAVWLGIGGVLQDTTGMWLTSDGGTTWREAKGAGTGEYGLAALGDLVVVALPTHLQSGDVPVAPARASSDGGRTWRETGTLPRGVGILALIGTQVGIVAGTTEGVFVLRPDLSWTKVAEEPTIVNSIASYGAVLYAAGPSGLWRIRLADEARAGAGTVPPRRPSDLPQCPRGELPELDVTRPPPPGDQPGTGAATAEEAFRRLRPASTKFSMYPFGSARPTRDLGQLGQGPVWIVDASDTYIALNPGGGAPGMNNWFAYPARFVGCHPATVTPPSPAQTRPAVPTTPTAR